MRVEFDEAVVQQRLLLLAPDNPSLEESIALLEELDQLTASLRSKQENLATAIANNSSATAAFDPTNTQVNQAFSALLNDVARLGTLAARRPELLQRLNTGTIGQTTDLYGQTITTILDVTEDFIAEEQAELFRTSSASRVPVQLEVRLARDPLFLPRKRAADPIVLDPATQALLNGIGSEFLDPAKSDEERLRALMVQTLGVTSVRPQFGELQTAVGDLLNKLQNSGVQATSQETALTSLKTYAEKGIAGLQPQPGEQPGDVLARATQFVSVTAIADLSGQLSSIRLNFEAQAQALQALRPSYEKVVSEVQETVAAIQSVVNGTLSYLGIKQNFEEIQRWRKDIDTLTLAPVYDLLEGREIADGDKVAVRLYAVPVGADAVLIGEPQTFRTFDRGWFRRDQPMILYAVPSDDDLENTPGIGYSAIWHPDSGRARDLEAPPWGVGLNFATLNMDQDGSYEFGAGVVIGLLNDLLQVGYGYNLTNSEGYWFVGARLRVN